jgi:hypothetical protein
LGLAAQQLLQRPVHERSTRRAHERMLSPNTREEAISSMAIPARPAVPIGQEHEHHPVVGSGIRSTSIVLRR